MVDYKWWQYVHCAVGRFCKCKPVACVHRNAHCCNLGQEGTESRKRHACSSSYSYVRSLGHRLRRSSLVPVRDCPGQCPSTAGGTGPVSYTHLRAHETRHDLVCRLLLEKK